jgi:hypothetical protein
MREAVPEESYGDADNNDNDYEEIEEQTMLTLC